MSEQNMKVRISRNKVLHRNDEVEEYNCTDKYEGSKAD